MYKLMKHYAIHVFMNMGPQKSTLDQNALVAIVDMEVTPPTEEDIMLAMSNASDLMMASPRMISAKVDECFKMTLVEEES